MITYLQNNPYFEVEADNLQDAEKLAEAQAIAEGYNLNDFIDMEWETDEEAI